MTKWERVDWSTNVVATMHDASVDINKKHTPICPWKQVEKLLNLLRLQSGTSAAEVSQTTSDQTTRDINVGMHDVNEHN